MPNIELSTEEDTLYIKIIDIHMHISAFQSFSPIISVMLSPHLNELFTGFLKYVLLASAGGLCGPHLLSLGASYMYYWMPLY